MKQTPNINLPILEQGDKYLKETQNEAFSVIDREIAGLNRKIETLDNAEGSIIDTKNDVETLKNETNTLKASLNDMESNVIPNIQTSLDNVETEIEENKTLTDSEISKLKEIVNTWETFKNTGGDIGGAINFPFGATIDNITKPITISGNTMYYRENVTNNSGFSHLSRFEDDSLGGKVNQNGIEFRKNYGETSGAFRPMVDNALDLGSSNYKWKDIYLNGINKNTNGYTKLPNGVILQWGSVEARSPGVDYRVNYPIRFPNKCIAVSIENIMNVNSDKREFSRFCTWNTSMADHFAFRGEGFTNWVYPSWIAIGY